jgi:multidrug transporter EmrE-like cation transporter
MSSFFNLALNYPITKKSSHFHRIKSFIYKLLKGSIIESIILCTIVLIGSFFMQSIIPIIPVLYLTLGKNFFLRAISLSFQDSDFTFKNAMIIVINFFMAANFAFLFNGIAVTLLHEIGHMLAAYIIYIDPSPYIQIFSLSGGATSYITDQLSVVGNLFSFKIANSLVSSAGFLITLPISLFMLYLANKKNPLSQLYAFLTTSAIYAIASDALYAFSAINNPSQGNDFLSLWQIGIHPFFSILFLLASPLLFSFLFLKLKKNKKLTINSK